MKNLTWQNPEQLFVAQVLINKVKSKCCGIKDKRSAHDDGGVTCDIVVVVGFSLLVPFLKWAYAHQAGSRFQNEVTAISLKNR